MKKLIRSFIVTCLFTHAAFAHADTSCASIVTSAQEAADRADLVIEATITFFLHPADQSKPMEVVTEKSRALLNLESSKVHATMSLPVDSCFPDRQRALSKQAVDRMTGKRMRLYLTRLTSSRGFRLFFIQPVEEVAPDFKKIRRSYVTKAYPDSLRTSLPDGWSRAHSTDGMFSIEMPGAFVDATKGGPGEPGFMLRTQDQDGSTYLAVFERSGPDAAMSGTLDDMYEKPDSMKSSFKGAMAVTTIGTIAGPSGNMTSHGIWFRVPGGTFMLGVVASKEHEAQALKNKDRFFNSLKFN